MKVEIISKDLFKIYLNKEMISSFSFLDKENAYSSCKEILLFLKNYKNLTFNGLYKMDLYLNLDIGIVIYLELIEEEEFELNSIDISIDYHNDTDFFIKLDELLHDESMFLYKDNYYVKLNKDNLFKFLELGSIEVLSR